MENRPNNVPHIHKKSNHKYLYKDPELFPVIVPAINDSSQLELMAGTQIIFTTNLAKHYDFRRTDRKAVKAVYVWYTMEFPFIQNAKQILLPYRGDAKTPRPAYIHIRDKDYDSAYYKNIGTRVILPSK